jgi:hypothetical protein
MLWAEVGHRACGQGRRLGRRRTGIGPHQPLDDPIEVQTMDSQAITDQLPDQNRYFVANGADRRYRMCS